MAQPARTIHAVAWTDVFPWLAIFRIFGLATSMPILFLATVALLLTPLGWFGAELLLSQDDRVSMFDEVLAPNRSWAGQEMAWQKGQPQAWSTATPTVMVSPLQQVFEDVTRPFVRLFRRSTSLRQFGYFLVGGLWTLAIWALFGGAITRIAAVRIGRHEREGMVDAVRFTGSRYLAFFASPLFPLAGVATIVALSFPVGVVMRADLGLFLASLLWLLVLLGGVIMAVLLLGLALGWPLMWGALACEEMGDVFEASQRCYSYTFGKPLHYLFYAVVALLFGAAGWLLVYYFAELVIVLSDWAVSWGAGNARLNEIAQADSGVAGMGSAIIQLCQGLVYTVATAFRYSFFWCAAAAIYLLLRRSVDHTEMDNVYMEDEPQRYGLPALSRDAAGVPGVEQQP
jgi:hypothetical protein